MMQISTIIFFAFLGATTASTIRENLNLKIDDDQADLEQPYFAACGGQLNATRGAIAYKADESISSNERCVWVIRAPAALTYTLEVLSFGLQTAHNDTGIRTTCVRAAATTVYHTSINSTGIVSLGSSNCPILILTFYSGENVLNSRGFVMFYTSTNGSHGISPSAQNYVFTAPEGQVRHPPNMEQNYTNNDVSTFVLAPPENIHNPTRKSLVIYSADSLEPTGCNDAVFLYRFNSTTGWQHIGANTDDYICASVSYRIWTSDDMLMFIFRSSASIVGRGFHIIHSELPLLC